MKKYRINWNTILRNMIIILFLICVIAELQIKYYEIRIEQIDEELEFIDNLMK